MRIPLIASAIFALAAQGVAQDLNIFHVYTNRTSFTSRGFLGGNAGETLQGYPGEQFRGIGDVGQHRGNTEAARPIPKRCFVHAFGMITQDQNRGTVEMFRVIFRRASGVEPDGTAAGIIAQTDKLSLPTRTGNTPIAWRIVVNLGEAGVRVPHAETFFGGLSLDANPDWTADGQSTWASPYTNPTSTSGDPVRAGAPSHAYQVDSMGAVRATNPRSWNYDMHTKRGAFQVGAIQGTNALYGNCGNYPDVDEHGLAFRLRDDTSPDKMAVLAFSESLIGGAPGVFDGHFWINPGLIQIMDTGTTNSSGFVEFKPAMTSPNSPFLQALKGMGNLPFQAFIINMEKQFVRGANAQATNL